MNLVESFKVITGCTEEEANVYLELAKSDILRETNRTVLPDDLVSAQIDIAIFRYNQKGIEGELTHSQGGVSSSFESLPEYIQKMVKAKRLAGVGGHAFEKKTNEKIHTEES